MTEFICMNRLNPFGTGKVFKQKNKNNSGEQDMS